MLHERNEKYATFYNYYVVGKKPRKPSNLLKILFVLFLCILLVFVVAFFRIRKTNSKTKFDKFAYLIVVGEFTHASDAKDLSEKVEKSGGSGFVWIEEKYCVVAFVYPTAKKAEKVKQNLTETSWDASIKKVSIKKPTITKLANANKQALDFAWKGMAKLYDLAMGFDDNKLSETQIYKNLTDFEHEMNLIIGKLLDDEIGLTLKTKLNLLKNDVNLFLDSLPKTSSFSSKLKTLCVKFVYACCNLYGDIV